MPRATLPMTAAWEKQAACPSAKERRNTLWYVYTMENYVATKRNEVPSHAATWMKLGSVRQSERCQSGWEKVRYTTKVCDDRPPPPHKRKKGRECVSLVLFFLFCRSKFCL